MTPTQLNWIASLGRPRVTIPLLVFIAVTSIPFVYRASRLTGLPAAEPFDVDAFVETYPGDPAKGCWPEYDRATALLIDESGFYTNAAEREAFRRGFEGWTTSNGPFRDYITANRAALGVWQDAMRADIHPRIHPRDIGTIQPASGVGISGVFIQLAIAEADRRRSVGDVVGAWELYEAGLRFTRHLSQCGDSVDRSIASIYVSMFCRAINSWSRLESVDRPLLLRARRAVAATIDLSPPLTETVKVDHLLMQGWTDDFSTTLGLVGEVSPWRLWIEFEPEVGQRLYDQSVRHHLAAAALPRSTRLAECNDDGFLRNPEDGDLLPGDELSRRIERSLVARELVGRCSFQSADQETDRLRVLDTLLVGEIARRTSSP